MHSYFSDFNTIRRRMAAPLDKIRLKSPRHRDKPERTSQEAMSLIKRLFYNRPWKAWKYQRMTESHSVASHKRHFFGSRMLRRRFPKNKNSPPVLLFSWSHPNFCCSLDSPKLSWQHNNEAPEPFVRPNAPELLTPSTFQGSAWQRFSSLYGQVDSSIQSRVNRKRSKATRTRVFTPLPAIKEEGGNPSSSQIYQSAPIRIARNTLPIEEEEEENDLLEDQVTVALRK